MEKIRVLTSSYIFIRGGAVMKASSREGSASSSAALKEEPEKHSFPSSPF